MKRLHTMFAVLSMVALSATATTNAFAQAGGGDQPPAQGQQGGPGGPGGGQGRGNWNPEQMRERMMNAMRERLAVTDDEEWKVLSVKIEKVFTLQRQANAGGMMGMMGRGPGGGGPGGGGGGNRGGGPGGPQGPVAEKSRELQTAAADKASSDADLKAKLDALREAKKAAREDLVKAQKELQEIVTVRQEALLVAAGLLD